MKKFPKIGKNQLEENINILINECFGERNQLTKAECEEIFKKFLIEDAGNK